MRPSDDQLTAWMRAVFAGRASSETIAAISEEVRRARAAEVDALGRLAHASQELHQRSGHDGTWAECQAASCAGDRELANTTRCAGCQRSIDPTTCWCGSPVDGHGYGDGHSPVPMGCECHRGGNHAAD